MVEDVVRPQLEKLLASNREEIQTFRSVIQELLKNVQQLEKLPLFQSHLDLNEMNLMVLDNGELSGILDWELSPPPTPFGIGCNRLHTIAGQINNQIYGERENYLEMEKAFWDEIVGGGPQMFRKMLEDNPEAIQTSFTIGTILNALDTGTENFNKAVLKALPKWATYRIPALRGNAPPYSI